MTLNGHEKADWNIKRLAGLSVHRLRRALAAGGEVELPPGDERATLVAEFGDGLSGGGLALLGPGGPPCVR
ncbi:hypothetical protein OG689_03295 [Kitasatospora sp. NBC_00240]|uniref:hypothetical protein n=1 Tax=Kitasatospora sp. NBC_00240 TaxID=2903567 RepID=UPI002250F41A|nr:hypothetical protein [Kitasatospora sp. NBC_00240]MCX5208335.1 hypothetical protein [Kitasatospora sp. NBC_00240]